MLVLLLCCLISSSLSRLGGAAGGRAVRRGVCVCATATEDRSRRDQRVCIINDEGALKKNLLRVQKEFTGGRAAAARNLRHNANRARPSTGKHTPRLGHTAPRARPRERGWLLAREESFRDPLQDHAGTHHPAAWRSAGLQSVFACRLSFARAPWASGWLPAGDAALSAQPATRAGWSPAAGD